MEITRFRRRFHRLRLAQKRPFSWYMMPGNWVVHSEEIQHWTKQRRVEVLQLVQDNIFGTLPPNGSLIVAK